MRIRVVSLVIVITVCKSRGRVRLSGNLRWPLQEQVGKDSPRAEGSSDPKAFMAGGEPDAIICLAGSDKGQFIGCSGAVTSPDASGGEFAEAGHVFESAIEHPVENMLVDGGAVRIELAG